MITSATPSQVSVSFAPVVQPTFMAENQQTVFKPLTPVMKSDVMAGGDKERHISSPLAREVAASGYAPASVQSLVTYTKDGRLSTAGAGAVASAEGRREPEGRAITAGDSGTESAKSDSEASTKEVIADARVKAAKAKQEEQMQQEIRTLAARDREVRAHEQAHAAVGGAFAGAPKYQFERGPDGVNYAVGGEVPIDVSPAATPEATIAKMQAVRRAALAPAEPSPQDRRVAQEAIAAEASARQEMQQKQRVEEGQAAAPADDAQDTARADNGPNVQGANDAGDEQQAGSAVIAEQPGNVIRSRDGKDTAPSISSISVVA